MTDLALAHPAHGSRSMPADLDAEVRHVRDLVFVRTLLAERGAAAEELAACDIEIEHQRRRLAACARRSAARYAA